MEPGAGTALATAPSMITKIQQTLRTAFVRSPASTFLIVLILSLGIGASTTLFSVLDSVLWRPLPFDEPESLISVLEGEKGRNSPTSPASFLALRDSSSTLKLYVLIRNRLI